jgi:uncharacterized protein
MIVVADSTPLIALSVLHKLNLLQELYGRIVIGPTVYQEIVIEGRGRSGAAEVASADWIETRLPGNPASLQEISPHLGRGEAETIVLARELPADLVIMDELAGRRELTRQKLALIGSIGVLQQAKLQGLIVTLKPELDTLRHSGFYLSERVYNLCLASAGE